MQHRLKQLPLNVQKNLYEITGMAGTSCPKWGSTEYNLEHRISWHDVIQEAYGTSRQGCVYREYLRSPEWQQKRQAVLNRAILSFIRKPLIIRQMRDRYGRKTICERGECLNVAKDVHHWNYDRVGKEQIGMEPEASEENDLIALCGECQAALHAEEKITG